MRTSGFVAAMDEAAASVRRFTEANRAAAVSAAELARAREAAQVRDRVSAYWEARARWMAGGRRADLEAMLEEVSDLGLGRAAGG
jgi:hypothetical protein